MTTIETRRYEMLVRVRDFGEAQLDLFPASSVARDQFGAVGAAVRALTTHAVDKMSATREGRNVKPLARHQPLEHLVAVRLTARAIAQKTLGSRTSASCPTRSSTKVCSRPAASTVRS
jgi:hypothetical protein